MYNLAVMKKLDLTTLSAGQIALVTVIGSLLAAVIAAVSSYVTATINTSSAARLEYNRVIREAKIEQTQELRDTLDRQIQTYIDVRASRKPPRQTGSCEDSGIYLPVFLASDTQALVRLANDKRRALEDVFAANPDTVSDDTLRQVFEYLQVLIVLKHMVEISLLTSNVDPTAYETMVRDQAQKMLQSVYDPYKPSPPPPRGRSGCP